MSAAFSAPLGAQPSISASGARNLEQIICAQLLRTPVAELAKVGECDPSGASRMRANERPMTLRIWLKVMDFLGYKLIGKDKLCTSAEEMHMLRLGYAFISENPEISQRFAMWQESRTRTLDWTGVE